MSRENKFRVWDKLENKYIKNRQPILLGFDGSVKDLDAQEDITSSVVIEQYTGLRDKNGREIYEGDIIKLGRHVYEIYWAGLAGRYDGRCLTKKKETYLNDISPFGLKVVAAAEIIGNIHENPELLENNE